MSQGPFADVSRHWVVMPGEERQSTMKNYFEWSHGGESLPTTRSLPDAFFPAPKCNIDFREGREFQGANIIPEASREYMKFELGCEE